MTTVRSVDLPAELAATIASAAAWRGMTVEQYVSAVLTRAARLDAELAADIKQGEDDLAAGRSHSQAEVEAMFGVRREQRRAA